MDFGEISPVFAKFEMSCAFCQAHSFVPLNWQQPRRRPTRRLSGTCAARHFEGTSHRPLFRFAVAKPFVVEEPASVMGALCGTKDVEDTAFTGDVKTPLVLKSSGCGLVAIGTLMPSTVRYWFHAFVAVLTKYSEATWLPPRLS